MRNPSPQSDIEILVWSMDAPTTGCRCRLMPGCLSIIRQDAAMNCTGYQGAASNQPDLGRYDSEWRRLSLALLWGAQSTYYGFPSGPSKDSQIQPVSEQCLMKLPGRRQARLTAQSHDATAPGGEGGRGCKLQAASRQAARNPRHPFESQKPGIFPVPLPWVK